MDANISRKKVKQIKEMTYKAIWANKRISKENKRFLLKMEKFPWNTCLSEGGNDVSAFDEKEILKIANIIHSQSKYKDEQERVAVALLELDGVSIPSAASEEILLLLTGRTLEELHGTQF